MIRILFVCACLFSFSCESYILSESYNYTNFFNKFDFEAIADPTHGTVAYINSATALSSGLASYTSNNKVYLGVDSTTVLASGGRKSIRLKSKREYNGNVLIIIDLDHMPTTAGNVLAKGCSLWPAFWTVGPNWPNNGEIDIIEYVNKQTNSFSALHTNKKCSMANMNTSTLSGTYGSRGCYGSEPGQSANSGCSITGSGTVGSAFNLQGGGVYAMEWTNDKYIRIYSFSRSSVPQDIISKSPDPSTWGLPYARFDIGGCGSSCSSDHFKGHNIIFDTTFCGDWAGNVFSSCSTTTTCSSFVRNNPSEFTEAYWLVNYVNIYNLASPVMPPTVAPTSQLTALPYSLTSTYDASNFFSNFNFQTIADPSHGTVSYINYTTASSLGLAKYVNNKVYMGVESKTVLASGAGRKSLRIQSNRILNGNSLVIIDLDHMPSTVGNVLPQGCSVWPAFWSVGPGWPNSGEIDIIEYVNRNDNVSSTLHTSYGCDQYSAATDKYYGYSTTKNCDTNAAGQSNNAGCGFKGKSGTVGASFNQAGGGVYAMEWDTRQHIRMFYFPRVSIPQDIQNKKPNPSLWGLPYARFEIGPACSGSKCSADHFSNHRLVFDTTLCGDWAGNVFSSCSTSMTCSTFVRNNPSEFTEAYWSINYLDIYDAPATYLKQYVGCYGDATSRAMDAYIATVSSIQECNNIAAISGYKYFGLQYGGECWLSNSYSATTRYGLCGQCAVKGCTNPTCNCANRKCASGEDCGDGRAYAVYEVINLSDAPSVRPTFNPSCYPTFLPSAIPSCNPSSTPSLTPSIIPSETPSASPSANPSINPTLVPSTIPSCNPSNTPSLTPSIIPSETPSASPSANPSINSTLVPSTIPSCNPSNTPSLTPSIIPSATPSVMTSASPSINPTILTSSYNISNSTILETPSIIPTLNPSEFPLCTPPSNKPTVTPSLPPSIIPTTTPSIEPTILPSFVPTSQSPTLTPVQILSINSKSPSLLPSFSPTMLPTLSPSSKTPTKSPSISPTKAPILPTTVPTSILPSNIPTITPTKLPTRAPITPTKLPTRAPIKPTVVPTRATTRPTVVPTRAPTRPTVKPTKAPISKAPTKSPTKGPTKAPTRAPTRPTVLPTKSPTSSPTKVPTVLPTITKTPTVAVALGNSKSGSANNSLINSSTVIVIIVSVLLFLMLCTFVSLYFYYRSKKINIDGEQQTIDQVYSLESAPVIGANPQARKSSHSSNPNSTTV